MLTDLQRLTDSNIHFYLTPSGSGGVLAGIAEREGKESPMIRSEHESVMDAILWLRGQAILIYPDSAFARNY